MRQLLANIVLRYAQFLLNRAQVAGVKRTRTCLRWRAERLLDIELFISGLGRA